MKISNNIEPAPCPELFLSYDVDQFITTLMDKGKATKLYDTLGWYSESTYFADTVNSILPTFIVKNREKVRQYLLNDSSNNELIADLMHDIFENQYATDAESMIASLRFYARDVDDYLDSIISTLTYKHTINLFGFGIANGAFEESLKLKMLNINRASQVNIYGYDPYISSTSPEIKLVEHLDKELSYPRMDFVICRWVLHHVNYKYRWGNFIKLLNHLEENATVVIIEEGCFPTRAEKLKRHIKMYEFLLCCADVVVNYNIDKTWVFSALKNNNPPFFIDHLTQEDWNEIEQHLQFNYIKNIKKIGKSFFQQNIVTYRCRRKA